MRLNTQQATFLHCLPNYAQRCLGTDELPCLVDAQAQGRQQVPNPQGLPRRYASGCRPQMDLLFHRFAIRSVQQAWSTEPIRVAVKRLHQSGAQILFEDQKHIDVGQRITRSNDARGASSQLGVQLGFSAEAFSPGSDSSVHKTG
jgi:hypothetical protein